MEGILEDVRMSNFAYSQTKISEYLTTYFAIIGLGSAIIASELDYADSYTLGASSLTEDPVDGSEQQNKSFINTCLLITTCSTVFLSNSKFLINFSFFNHCQLQTACIMEENQTDI